MQKELMAKLGVLVTLLGGVAHSGLDQQQANVTKFEGAVDKTIVMSEAPVLSIRTSKFASGGTEVRN